MTAAPKDPFVVAFSSSALFDTRAEDTIYRQKGEEAFIEHQIKEEERVFLPGSAMPVAKALLAIDGGIADALKLAA